MAEENGGNRRQWMLLGALLVALVAYLRYSGVLPGGSVDGVSALPPINAREVEASLQDINTVNPGWLAPPRDASSPDRNLFQYGVRKPPPPTPAEIAAAKRALEIQEETARAQKAQQEAQLKLQQEEAARAIAAAAEAAKNNPPQAVDAQGNPVATVAAPAQPQVPQMPVVNFRLVGMMGSERKRLGVFLDGNNVLLARKGEVIGGKFMVLDLGLEWADIGSVDPQLKGQKKRINFGS